MMDKHIPAILAHSYEFSSMKVRSQQELDVLKRIKQHDKVRDAIPKQKLDDTNTPVQVKPICLLMGYMYGILEEADY